MVSIILAEDEKITALDLQLGLKRLGYNVIKVVDKGLDLINAAQNSEPDVIVSDIHLKDEINGIEALNKILETKKLHIVVISGYNDEKTKDAVTALNPCAFIRKPCTAKDINNVISHCLQ